MLPFHHAYADAWDAAEEKLVEYILYVAFVSKLDMRIYAAPWQCGSASWSAHRTLANFMFYFHMQVP